MWCCRRWGGGASRKVESLEGVMTSEIRGSQEYLASPLLMYVASCISMYIRDGEEWSVRGGEAYVFGAVWGKVSRG